MRIRPILRRGLALLVSIAVLAPAALAAPAWHHAPDGEGGYEVYFGEAEEAERIAFLAACNGPGLAIQVWYLTARSRLTGQTVDARGLRQEVDGLTVTLVIDGTAFTYDDARAVPDATYDANVIILLLNADDPLFPALAQGSRLGLAIEAALGDSLSLEGSHEPFARLVRFCRGRPR
jgi:hypothetical protein